ncbi:MAG: hypothetical protein JJU37_12015 [Balneolaceae bacterium]|nr:hypothetical protein [Balneolaceae bacterium]
MLKVFLFVCIGLFPVLCVAQSVSVAPYSFNFWGSIDQTSQFSAEYKMAGIHYFHTWDDEVYRTSTTGQFAKKTSSFALSLLPVDFTYLRFGGIFFTNRFPITSGNRVHFYLELNLPIRRVDLSYRHISNGFNLFTEDNPGFDTIALRFRF